MTLALASAVPVTGWDATESEWLAARNNGVSASDIAAVLGFSQYDTPWQVWAEKTGLRPRGAVDNEAIRLGNDLEPWLLTQAQTRLNMPVVRTRARLYAHPDHAWRLASPDGEAQPAGRDPFGIEAKTAGLAGGFGIPDGWSEDRVPLGYEFQARWQMHVMGWRRVVIVGLVAGIGLRAWPIDHNSSVETDMVEQVTDWYQQHVVNRVEPPIRALDNNVMADIWPTPTLGSLPLDDDPDIVELLYAHAEGHEQEKDGKDKKAAAAAAMKRKLGDHEIGTIGNRPVVTWKTTAAGTRRIDVKGI